jgi:adenine-specific DNA-methyltransferase
MHPTPAKFNELVKKLREIFQIDKPELDFGIYRILNARAGEINDYLQNRLYAKVQDALASGQHVNQEQLARELKEKVEQYTADGVNPDNVPRVKELRQKLAAYSNGTSEHQDAVFSHLLTFFSRYYDNGDFISQRRYKGDTYAIPYAGEEVMLHWANKDQYYTKSGENFSNYSFKLDDGQGNLRLVHFRLVAADTAKDNRKDNDKERRFVLIDRQTVTRIDDDGEEYQEELLPVEMINAPDTDDQQQANRGAELIIHFEYKAMPKGTKQDTLTAQAIKTILADEVVKTSWLDLAQRAPTEKNPQRTLLEKHLNTYTEKNTADYFIHKDLGGFLKRELDFYIKNEVMHLDDVQNAEKFADIEKSLRMIQCLRAIAVEVISFLAQIENFQKKLWLKKKFVVSSHYCVTLDRIPEKFYSAIVANKKQWEIWKALNFLPVVQSSDLFLNGKFGTVEFLKEHPFLMLDTSCFERSFQDCLINSIEYFESLCNGVLVHSDNFQAMNILSEKYKEKIKCIYTDPPYNTKNEDFLYKDNFKHSSWASMMYDRLLMGHKLLAGDGILSHYIDENEHSTAGSLINLLFGEQNRCADIVWKNTSRNDQNYVSAQHEYILTAVKDRLLNKGEWREKKEGLDEIYTAFNRFRKQHGTDWKKIHKEALEFYNSYPESNPIYDCKHYSWMDERGVYFPSDISGPNFGQYVYDVVHPITMKNCKRPTRGWSLPYDAMQLKIKEKYVHFGDDETTIPNLKTYLSSTEYNSLTSIKYKDGRVASKQINSMFGKKTFSNPKDVELTCRFLQAFETEGSVILDFFAGTGTTAHSIIDLERQKTTGRKYILIEQGEYFEKFLKHRIQLSVFSTSWKDGKPTAPETGISHAFKVLKLESYEDTLNNLELRRTNEQGDLLNSLSDKERDDYLLHYMLDVESRGSLLSVDMFKKPFDVSLKVAVDSAGASEVRKIDMVETFNYLIGLTVNKMHLATDAGYARIEGTLPSGETALILWRDCERIDYEELMRLAPEFGLDGKDKTYDVIYVNGDHNIPSSFTETEADGGTTRNLKLRQIEPEFLNRMFSTEDV